MSRNLKLLVADGFVRTEQDDFDHRVQHLSLTDAGQSLFETTLPKMRERQRYLRSTLSTKELDTLYKALDKLEIAAEWRGDIQ